MRTLQTFALALPLSALLAGCTAHVIDVGAQADSGSPPALEAGSPVPDGGSTAPGVYTAAQVQAAQALCSAAHGPVDAYTTPGDFKAHLEGAWLLCGPNMLGGNLGVTVAGSGIYAPDGSFHALLPDSTGGLVEGQGITSTATYSVINLDDASADCATVDDAGNFGGCLVNYVGAAGQIVQFGAAFEKSPRRMLLGQTDWYVALP